MLTPTGLERGANMQSSRAAHRVPESGPPGELRCQAPAEGHVRMWCNVPLAIKSGTLHEVALLSLQTPCLSPPGGSGLSLANTKALNWAAELPSQSGAPLDTQAS